MLTVINVVGAEPTDTCYSLDENIFGQEIIWNVTKLQAAAKDGKLGAPIWLPVSLLPPMDDAHRANIDWPKVKELQSKREALFEPAICIMLTAPTMLREGAPVALHRIIVDGNHRITARIMNGETRWVTFIVQPEREANYRITIHRREVSGV